MANDLDNPIYAAFAWKRYRHLLFWMALASAAAAGLSLAVLTRIVGALPLHMAIATGLGVFFTVMLAAALMGLVFLSSGSGHDELIVDPFAGDEP